MKKFIILLVLCVASASVYAASTTQPAASNIDIYTAVGVIFSTFGDAIWSLITSKVTASLLTVFLTLAYFLDPIIERIAWTPANKILVFAWWLFKKILGFAANKKAGANTPAATVTAPTPANQ